MIIRSRQLTSGYGPRTGASSNTFSKNTVDGPNGDRGIVVDGPTTSNNGFSDNHIANARYAIRITSGNVNSKFINNHLDTTASSGEFTLSAASALKSESTQFSNDVIRALDSTSIPLSISKSGKIRVIDGSVSKSYDTNVQPYTKTLKSGSKIIVTSVSSVLSLANSSSLSEVSSSRSGSPTDIRQAETNESDSIVAEAEQAQHEKIYLISKYKPSLLNNRPRKN